MPSLLALENFERETHAEQQLKHYLLKNTRKENVKKKLNLKYITRGLLNVEIHRTDSAERTYRPVSHANFSMKFL